MFGIHDYKKEYSELLTGQLAAYYKASGEEQFRKEYLRRLKYLGFSRKQAEDMFEYELSVISDVSAGLLTDDNYVESDYFDMKSKLLESPYESYIEHKMFTVSEITKICDEAEWHHANDDTSGIPDDVVYECERLGSYGEEGLYVRYLRSVSMNTGIPFELIQQYSVAEQDLLFYCKWNDDAEDEHPYGAI